MPNSFSKDWALFSPTPGKNFMLPPYMSTSKDYFRIYEGLCQLQIFGSGDFKIKLEPNGKITFSNKANSLDAITVQKIFYRYFSIENAKKSTGIGLSIAKQLVELNNGIISAKYVGNFIIIEIFFN